MQEQHRLPFARVAMLVLTPKLPHQALWLLLNAPNALLANGVTLMEPLDLKPALKSAPAEPVPLKVPVLRLHAATVLLANILFVVKVVYPARLASIAPTYCPLAQSPAMANAKPVLVLKTEPALLSTAAYARLENMPLRAVGAKTALPELVPMKGPNRWQSAAVAMSANTCQ